MNKRTLGVAAVFLVGCAVGGASSQLVVPKASAQQAATLTKWEYKCAIFGSESEFGPGANAMGAEGWDLVVNDRLKWCFKRPKM